MQCRAGQSSAAWALRACEKVQGIVRLLCPMPKPLTQQAHAPVRTCRAGGGAGGEVAKDALGNDVKESQWVQTHLPGDRSLVQGLKVRGTWEQSANAGGPNLMWQVVARRRGGASAAALHVCTGV